MAQSKPALELVPPGSLRELLVDAVLRGAKTATTRLSVMDDMSHAAVEQVGTVMDLVDSAGHPVCAVVIREVRQCRLADVEEDVALAEGDWFRTVAQWREAHERYWADHSSSIREYLGDPDWQVTDNSMVTIRFFDVVLRW